MKDKTLKALSNIWTVLIFVPQLASYFVIATGILMYALTAFIESPKNAIKTIKTFRAKLKERKNNKKP